MPRERVDLARCAGQRRKAIFGRKLDIDDLLAAFGARQHRRQAVIILRADHDIDARRAADDLLALGLRDAACHRDRDLASALRRLLLEQAHAAELGVNLLRRLLADVAGIEDDEVGVIRLRGFGEAGRRHEVRHTMRVVDVHLAAE